jgi:hypothetical protein
MILQNPSLPPLSPYKSSHVRDSLSVSSFLPILGLHQFNLTPLFSPPILPTFSCASSTALFRFFLRVPECYNSNINLHAQTSDC